LALTCPVATAVPYFTHTFTASAALGGGNYVAKFVGADPFSCIGSACCTTISMPIIPLIITIGTQTFDPTTVDGCSGFVCTDYVVASPIFTNNDYIMNGVDIGSTQYIDAFQRATFFNAPLPSNYHVLVQPTIFPSHSHTFSSGVDSLSYDATTFGGCGMIGVVDETAMDTYLQSIISSLSLAPGQIPIFLTKSVVQGSPGFNINSNCCTLGYHSLLSSGLPYGIFSIDFSQVFGGDVTVMAHELAELFNDPTVDTSTPNWGDTGQVGAGQCQNNLEVGDPLSPGGIGATSSFLVGGYHLQELAFATWFYGTAGLSAGGFYSDHGSLTGPAALCPPGGRT